jgi:hypothetical protein
LHQNNDQPRSFVPPSLRLVEKRAFVMRTEAAEGVAAAVLMALAGDDDRLERFLSLSGLQPDTVRGAAADPAFLAGVLDYVMTDDALLVDCAAAIGEPAERISQAHHVLSPPVWAD